MDQNKIKIGLLIVIVLAIIAFFFYDIQQYTTLDYIKAKQQNIIEYYKQNFFFVLVLFIFLYVLVTALSLPVATFLTLVGGALFGFSTGLIIVSFASTIGATLAFLMARFLAQNYVQKNFKNQLSKINKKFKSEGSFYLFALRLVPVVPFFIINVVMGLMTIKTWTFYWVSQLGMLPGTIVYVYAGTQLAQIETFSDITSPSMLIAFALLGLFPLIAKNFIQFIRKDKNYD
jgi:uncharacterized membrane protein YdjX (TVP38/TMEM64 family)|tara:strand:- start:1446 stop:2138 length:693 start_codon:yes stop_codon:yes gene_type:complete